MKFRILWRALPLLFGVAIVGCPSGPGGESVGGKVTIGGKPAAGSTVTYIGPDSKTASCLIQDDGQYNITGGLALGANKIIVVGPTGAPKDAIAPPIAKDGPKTTGPTGPAIPPQYSDVEKSGLTYTIKAGKNINDIDLK